MAERETLILTRPLRQSRAFATAVEEALPGRFAVIVAPLIEIVPVAAEIDLAGLQGIVFTSGNGVEQFAARSGDRELPAFCVGEITAAAARAAGDLVALLAAAGVPARAAEIYDQVPRAIGGAARPLLAAGVPAVVALFSPRSARLFAAQARAAGWPLGRVTAVSLSANADAALDGLGLGRRLVAPAPGRAGMLAALAGA